MSKRKPLPNLSPDIAGPSRPNLQHQASSPAALQGDCSSGVQADIPDEEPPVYSGPSTLALSISRPAPSFQRSLVAGLPDLPWSKYQVPDATLTSDYTTITTTCPRYSSDPRALEAFLRDQASLPPKPSVRILGRSVEGFKDFDIWLNMMHYIIRRDGQTRQWNYVQVENDSVIGARRKRNNGANNVGNDSDGLKDMVERYCDEKSVNKTFTMTRNVVNWNTEHIEGSIRNLLAQMNYRGQLAVQFPIQFSKIIVQNPPKGNKFLHGVASLFTENKKYEGAMAVWPYATLAPNRDGDGGGDRVCAVQSEEAWCKDWRGIIAGAVRNKRRGWVSLEDQIEFAMIPRG